jgi:hypothetical protein
MHLLIALVLQATTPGAVPPPPEHEQVQPAVVSQPAEAAPPAAQPSAEPEVRCRRAATTGQRLARRICETVDSIEYRAQASSDAVRQMQGGAGGAIPDPGMRP